MPFKPSPNQFGQIVTCVAAFRALATRMGGLVEFRTFDSFYKDKGHLAQCNQWIRQCR